MGQQFTGTVTFQRGLELDETGLNSRAFSCRYFMQWRELLPNYQGQFRGFSQPDKLSREIKLTGEIPTATASGVMLAVWNVALTLANDIGTFIGITSGTNAGGVYLVEVTESQTSEGWRTADFSFESHPLIA